MPNTVPASAPALPAAMIIPFPRPADERFQPVFIKPASAVVGEAEHRALRVSVLYLTEDQDRALFAATSWAYLTTRALKRHSTQQSAKQMRDPECAILQFPKARRVPSRRSPRRSCGLEAARNRQFAAEFRAKAETLSVNYDCGTCERGPSACASVCRFAIYLVFFENFAQANASRLIDGSTCN
jgi:hypothetical protein